MAKKFICNEEYLNEKKYIIKYFDDLKDELIVFKDKNENFKCFSSVCPHLAGEICYNKQQLYCKWHGLKFDSKGQTINSRVKLSLNEYKIYNTNGEIYIETE